jgi:hypothetical protein
MSGLWIRTQERTELVFVCSFKIQSISERNNKHRILGILNNVNELGVYETEERALEILEEIQEMIARNDGHILFVMPEK